MNVKMQLKKYIKNITINNIISFILTNILFMPFNFWLRSTLNNRFYLKYIILFLVAILITFEVLLILSKGKSLTITKFAVFGISSGYIISILSYEGMCLFVLNKLFIPLNINEVFHLFIFAPFLLFGWIYGLIMGVLVYFLRRLAMKKNNKNQEDC